MRSTIPKNNLICAIELKSQIGSYVNNFNNRTEEAIGSAEDFWTAFREKFFKSKQSPWLGYLMLVGNDDESNHIIKINEPYYKVDKVFKDSTYIDRYNILCQRLLLEHKYNSVALIATSDKNNYIDIEDNISIESFIDSFKGHLLGLKNEFK